MRYVLDTNIWIEFLRKNPRVRTRLRETLTQRHEICVIPAHFDYPVSCILRQEQEATMLQMWRKFVRVSGLVVRDAHSGHPIEIRDIGEIRALAISAPDSYRNAAGILDLGGEAPEAVVKRLRYAPQPCLLC